MAQFHWGGGTPTYLSPEQIEDLFAYTRERFTFAPDAEIGIEVDPRVTTREHLETVRKLGFNRLSMGVQDFKPEVQKAIHRIQPYEETRDLIRGARNWVSTASMLISFTACRIRPRKVSRTPSNKSSACLPIASPCSAMRTCLG